MNCIIVEDQAPAQRILQHYINQVDFLVLNQTLTDPIEALTYLANHEVDLMFLDIHLPKISGINLLKTLRRAPHVILTTAHDNYALESYELNVVDYLLKPFSFERFLKAVSKVSKSDSSRSIPIQDNNADYIYLKTGHEHVKLRISDILYIKADSDYTEILTLQNKYLSSETLKHWCTTLGGGFYRVHRSYVVNSDQIIKVRGALIELTDAHIPIGRSYKAAFYADFLGE